MSLFRRLIRINQVLSYSIESMLPQELQRDGSQWFTEAFVPRYLRPGLKIYDVGGGRHPTFSAEQVRALNLDVTGIDISRVELDAAPPGTYARTWCADIAQVCGEGDGDLVLCRTLLEHVADVEKAISALASLLKPGGIALIFVPNRRAVFAQLNRLLPQEFKRRLLFTLFPMAREGQGFVAYYDRCTPGELKTLSSRNALRVEAEHYFYRSDYFTFFLPAHLLWRAYSSFTRMMWKEEASETFLMALEKGPLRDGAGTSTSTLTT